MRRAQAHSKVFLPINYCMIEALGYGIAPGCRSTNTAMVYLAGNRDEAMLIQLLFQSMQKCAEVIDEPIVCHDTACDILVLVEGTDCVVIVRSLRILLHFVPVRLAKD